MKPRPHPRSPILLILLFAFVPAATAQSAYPVVDTGQSIFYNASGPISQPVSASAFHGQDAQYTENPASYVDNGNGTITDLVTGLMWQADPGAKMTYAEAVAGAGSFELAGYTDWRLPDAKQLQSLEDYSRAPSSTGTAAIDPVFGISSITNEAGAADFPFFWSSTTHANAQAGGASAAYVSFGRALGYFMGAWTDVHGAGAQRSDPKVGDAADWPFGHGPQGDAIRTTDSQVPSRGPVTLWRPSDHIFSVNHGHRTSPPGQQGSPRQQPVPRHHELRVAHLRGGQFRHHGSGAGTGYQFL